MAQVSGNAADLMVAVDLGQDPINIVLKDRAVQGGRKAKDKGSLSHNSCEFHFVTHRHQHHELALSSHVVLFVDVILDISVRFGGISTQSAIDNRFRKVKVDAKSINKAVANGVDPFTLNIGDSLGSAAGDGKRGFEREHIFFQHYVQVLVFFLISSPPALLPSLVEVLRLFGQDTTLRGIQTAIDRYYKPKIALIHATIAAGGDPKDLKLPDIDYLSAKRDGQRSEHSISPHSTFSLHFVSYILCSLVRSSCVCCSWCSAEPI